MSIVVVTHNGQLPKDGGRRIGYIADGKTWIPLLGASVPLAALQSQMVSKQPTRKPILMYWDLPAAREGFIGDHCRECNSSDLHYFLQDTADAGERELVRCRSCGYLMRSF